jgi:hypothetical protein
MPHTLLAFHPSVTESSNVNPVKMAAVQNRTVKMAAAQNRTLTSTARDCVCVALHRYWWKVEQLWKF